MFNREISAHKGICYASTWRALNDGSEHPRYFVQLSVNEVAQLAATGSYTLPIDVIPESVKQWRREQESLEMGAESEDNPTLTLDALKEAASV